MLRVTVLVTTHEIPYSQKYLWRIIIYLVDWRISCHTTILNPLILRQPHGLAEKVWQLYRNCQIYMHQLQFSSFFKQFANIIPANISLYSSSFTTAPSPPPSLSPSLLFPPLPLSPIPHTASSPPLGLQLVGEAGVTSFNIEWNEPDMPNGVITEYEVRHSL